MGKYFENKKRVASLLMAMISFASLPTYALEPTAAPIDTDRTIIQPRFTNISIFQNVFDISANGKSSITTYLTARNVDEVRVTANLQQSKNGVWVTIKSWSNTSAGTHSGLNGTYYVSKGYHYRLVSSGKVYKNGTLIEQTSYVSESKYY